MRLRNEDVFQAFQILALFSNALNDKFVFIQIGDNLYFHICLLKPLCDLLFMLTQLESKERMLIPLGASFLLYSTGSPSTQTAP